MDWFTWHAIQAIATVGRQLKVCADRTCHKPFVARRRQAYCTRQCSDRTRLARFRARHAKDPTWKAKVGEQRRAAYESRIKRKLGPNVQVRTRGQRAT